MANRRHQATDQGVKMAIEVLVMVWVLSIGLYFASSYPPPTPRGDQVAYDQLEQNLEDVLSTGQYVCCARDPTAPNAMTDLALSTWAGNESAHAQFHRVFDQMFPPGTVYNLGLVYNGVNDNRPTRVPAVYEWNPTGQTVGTTELIKPHDRHQRPGPAYVVPRLENVTGQAPIDVTVIPLHPLMPYRLTPNAQHTRPTIETTITYQTQGVGLDEGRGGTADEELVKQTVHTHTSGAWTPSATLLFEEPDWTELTQALPREGANEPKPVLALTSEDLAAERLLQNETCRQNPLTPGCDTLSDEPYPQHAFQLNTTLHGPGHLTNPTNNPTLDNLYELTIHIPREWTDIEINQTDSDRNKIAGWLYTYVDQYPGETRITAYLTPDSNLTTRNLPTPDGPTRPHDVLPAQTTSTHPFHFHARPPNQTDSAELGFATLRATLENVQHNTTSQGILSVEVGTAAGRVHRTVQAVAPASIPPTPVAPGAPTPQGVDLYLGAVIQNGGDDILLHNLTIPLPEGVIVTPGQTPDAVWHHTTAAGTWTTTSTHVIWEPPATETLCQAMTTCGALSKLTLTGQPLPQASHLLQPQLNQFYNETNLGPYLSTYVLDAPDATDTIAGLATRTTSTRPGPTPGAYTLTLPPSTTPMCTQEELDDRTYQGSVLGQEDGYAWVESLTQCQLDDPLMDPEDHPGHAWFPLLVQTGNTQRDQTVTTVGKTRLQAVQGIPAEQFTNWQTAASQATITGPTTATPGSRPSFTVHMEGLVHALDESAQGSATIKLRALDPYNAWEDHPYKNTLLIKTGLADTDPGLSGTHYCKPAVVHDCASINDLPTTFTLGLDLPPGTPPGTHLLQIEVSWLWNTDTDETIGQTANLLYPFDVVSRNGAYQGLTGLEGVAWLEEWS